MKKNQIYGVATKVEETVSHYKNKHCPGTGGVEIT